MTADSWPKTILLPVAMRYLPIPTEAHQCTSELQIASGFTRAMTEVGWGKVCSVGNCRFSKVTSIDVIKNEEEILFMSQLTSVEFSAELKGRTPSASQRVPCWPSMFQSMRNPVE